MMISGALIFVSIILISCGGSKEINVKLNSTSIKGGLSDYFNVVEGTYKVTADEKYTGAAFPNHYQIKVQFKRNDKAFDFDAQSVLKLVGGFNLYCDLLDEQTAPVIQADRGGMITQGGSDGVEALASLKSGEIGWVIYHFSGEPVIMKKVKYFSIDSESGKNLLRSSNSPTSANIGNSSTVLGSVDCDQFIKDYSDFADSYIKLLKKYKANPTDTSILTEYSEAAQKAMNLQKDATNCNDPKYAKKLMEIAIKIAQAAM